MSNSTTTEAPFYDMGLGMPLWVIIVWAAVGVLLLAMIILILYACRTRKSAQTHDRISEDGERRMSVTTFDNYPQGYIDDLHTKQHITKQLFSPAFVHNMRIPRAVEVRMTDASRNSRHYIPQQNVNDPPRVSFEELGFHGYEYGHYDDEDDDFNELHPSRRITVSRDASFKASNISEENKAKQLYKERLVVNELREKIRRDKRIEEQETKW